MTRLSVRGPSRKAASALVLLTLLLSAVAAISPPAARASSLTNGLVAYWPLDNGAGSTASDASGNGNAGVLLNSPSWLSGASCKFGGCLGFSAASSQIVDVGHGPSLNTPSGVTLSLWIYPTESGYEWVWNKGSYNGATGTVGLVVYPNGHIEFSVGDGATWYVWDTGASVPANTWSHVVATYDLNTQVLYINGAMAASKGLVLASIHTNSIDGQMGWSGTDGQYYDGRIDDFRIYNRALTAGEAAELYALVPPVLTVPLIVDNSASSATPNGFQQEVTVVPSTYSAHEASDLGNVRFCHDSACASPYFSWLESCSSSPCNTAASATFWVNLGTDVVPAGGSLTIYMGLLSIGTEFDGVVAGESPHLSPIYGQYDNGGSVFLNYYRGDSPSGWSVYGGAGVTGGAPAGSPFGTFSFYTNGGEGDSLRRDAGYPSSQNLVIQYYVNAGVLGDFYFSADSGGKGTLSRLEGRAGADSGFAATQSWDFPPGWRCPVTGIGNLPNTWYQISIVISGGRVGDFYTTSPSLGSLGAPLNALSSTYTDGCPSPTTTETYSYQGSHIGIMGAHGGGGTAYYNGMVFRLDPPDGIMPTVSVERPSPSVTISSVCTSAGCGLAPFKTKVDVIVKTIPGIAMVAEIAPESTVDSSVTVLYSNSGGQALSGSLSLSVTNGLTTTTYGPVALLLGDPGLGAGSNTYTFTGVVLSGGSNSIKASVTMTNAGGSVSASSPASVATVSTSITEITSTTFTVSAAPFKVAFTGKVLFDDAPSLGSPVSGFIEDTCDCASTTPAPVVLPDFLLPAPIDVGGALVFGVPMNVDVTGPGSYTITVTVVASGYPAITASATYSYP